MLAIAKKGVYCGEWRVRDDTTQGTERRDTAVFYGRCARDKALREVIVELDVWSRSRRFEDVRPPHRTGTTTSQLWYADVESFAGVCEAGNGNLTRYASGGGVYLARPALVLLNMETESTLGKPSLIPLFEEYTQLFGLIDARPQDEADFDLLPTTLEIEQVRLCIWG
ncbi:hypothetical protein V494_04408 [Pseudogymnoascus sp. VKM F-4513 (FW-928)]|nr:hypothetical protein V494_04408 [Pseudogymnoascus sp. VKM F-4513 (FW-928)]